MRAFLQDIRHAIRQLRKSLGFSLIAILILALGIGAVTSIFSVVQAVLLNPFAYRDPGQLVVVRETIAELQKTYPMLPDNYKHFERLKNASKTLQDAAIFQDRPVAVSIVDDHPQILGSLRISSNFFTVLGVQPAIGRNFTEDETRAGAKGSSILISYVAWQNLFHGDRNVLGRTLRVGDEPQTIIGVLPQSFRFPLVAMVPGFSVNATAGNLRPYDIFVPMIPGEDELKQDAGNFNYLVLARLKPGVTASQAQAELDGLQKAYTQSVHLPMHLGINVQPFNTDITGRVSQGLWLLFAAVGSVLLIACVNLANLQLARSVSREHEVAVRSALGAGRWRLVQSRFAESLVLGCLGGVFGIVLAQLGIKLFTVFAPADLPRIQEIQMSWPVLCFAAGLSLLTAVLFGTLPAVRSLRVPPQSAMQSGTTRVANTRQGAATRNLLVGAEVACTVVLLIVTALVIRSFTHLLEQQRGFNGDHVTAAQVNLINSHYGTDRKSGDAAMGAAIERMLDQLRQIPGVQQAAITSAMPLTGDRWVDLIRRPDHPVPTGQEPQVNIRFISPDYINLLHIPLLEGRSFTEADKEHPEYVLISEGAAHEVWPGENPVGKQIGEVGNTGKGTATIIGVIADAHINDLKRATKTIYVPFWANVPSETVFLIKGTAPSQALASGIRRAIWNVDPEAAIPLIKSMDQQVGDSVSLERFQTLLLASFGAAALLLALLGIYGVLAYSVSLRSQEIGIRIALGATTSNLVRLIVRQISVAVAGGLCVGLLLAAFATRWLQSQLYETKAADPLAIAASIFLLLLTAVIAAILPARRAAKVDPAIVLRAE